MKAAALLAIVLGVLAAGIVGAGCGGDGDGDDGDTGAVTDTGTGGLDTGTEEETVSREEDLAQTYELCKLGAGNQPAGPEKEEALKICEQAFGPGAGTGP